VGKTVGADQLHVLLRQGDARKGLAFRQRSATSLQGLRLAATIGSFPLHTEYQVAEFGIGAWERTNGAVLFFDDGNLRRSVLVS
jgi:hypothetical protein